MKPFSGRNSDYDFFPAQNRELVVMSSRGGTGEHYLTAVMFTGWLLLLLNQVSTISTSSTCSPPSSDRRPPVLTHCHRRPKNALLPKNHSAAASSLSGRPVQVSPKRSILHNHNRPRSIYISRFEQMSLGQFLTSSSHYAATVGLSNPLSLWFWGLDGFYFLPCPLFEAVQDVFRGGRSC